MYASNDLRYSEPSPYFVSVAWPRAKRSSWAGEFLSFRARPGEVEGSLSLPSEAERTLLLLRGEMGEYQR